MLTIFDCDGVLVDTEAIACGCFAAALQREGLNWSVEETMRRLIGRSLAASVRIAEADLGRTLPAGFAERLQVDTFAAFRAAPVKAVKGVAAALDALDAAAIESCVASSGMPDKMRLTLGLAGLWQRFEGRIFSAAMVARAKPAPDLFLHAAATLRVPPQDCVVIEDAVPGVEAARAAGMRVLAYAAAPWADGAALAAAGAELFDDMAQLPGLLRL